SKTDDASIDLGDKHFGVAHSKPALIKLGRPLAGYESGESVRIVIHVLLNKLQQHIGDEPFVTGPGTSYDGLHDLVLQKARVVHVHRNPVSEERYDDAQANGSLACRDSHYHKYEKLACHVSVVSRERDERQVNSIEHQLDAHEHADRV